MLKYQSGFENAVLSDILQNIDCNEIWKWNWLMELFSCPGKHGWVLNSFKLLLITNGKEMNIRASSYSATKWCNKQNKRSIWTSMGWDFSPTNLKLVSATTMSLGQLKKKFKTDEWLHQLKTKAQLLEKWKEVKHRSVPQQQYMTLWSENEASIALLALIGGVNEEEDENEKEINLLEAV